MEEASVGEVKRYVLFLFAQRQVLVRDGKGGRDRVTPSERLGIPIQEHLHRVALLRQRDLQS